MVLQSLKSSNSPGTLIGSKGVAGASGAAAFGCKFPVGRRFAGPRRRLFVFLCLDIWLPALYTPISRELTARGENRSTILGLDPAVCSRLYVEG